MANGLTSTEVGEAKRRYLDWVDTRLRPGATQRTMNVELGRYGLIQKDRPDTKFVVMQNYRGWLSEVTVQAVPGAENLLNVGIGVGTLCGYDQAIAIYTRTPLKRVGVIEHKEPSGDRPVPWWYLPVVAQPADANGRRLLATAGNSGWCTSNIRGGELVVEEIQGSSMRLLLDRDISYWAGREKFITATVKGNVIDFRYEVLLYFRDDFAARAAIERFVLQGDTLQRAGPIAAGKGGFVEEWLVMNDAEAAAWSTPQAAKAHAALAAQSSKGVKFEEIARCPADTWQMRVLFHGSQQPVIVEIGAPAKAEMKVLKVSDHTDSDCRSVAWRELLDP